MPYMKKTCSRCGKEFKTTKRHQLYCSDLCASLARSEAMRRASKKRYERLKTARLKAKSEKT